MLTKKKVTIQDIAQRAEVSISTVSRVLNDNVRVALPKKEAVLLAIKELDYHPNLFAQGLASGQSMAIGVVTQNISSPFYDAILRGIRLSLDGSKYDIIFTDGHWQTKQEKKAIHLLLRYHVDGLIILGGETPAEYLQEIATQLPLIVLGRDLALKSGHCISFDDFQGAYQATQYLIELGHRHIVHITGLMAHEDAVARLAGYKQALLDEGLELNPELIIEGDFLEQSGFLAVEMLLTQRRTFSAVFAANDQMALGFCLGLYRRGIRVPDDVSLIGFDNQANTAYSIPPLTTVQQPSLEIGQAAGLAMLQLLRGEPFDIPHLPAKLIKRESVARYYR